MAQWETSPLVSRRLETDVRLDGAALSRFTAGYEVFAERERRRIQAGGPGCYLRRCRHRRSTDGGLFL